MGAEDGEVGVVALEVLVGMSIHHRQVVIIVLLADEAAGILAEGADLVLEGLRIAHQLGLIQHSVHHFHDLVADLHPDADVHRTGRVGDVMLGAQLLQPIRAPAAGGYHGVSGIDIQYVFPVGNQTPLHTSFSRIRLLHS